MTSPRLRSSLVMVLLTACPTPAPEDVPHSCDPGFVADGDTCVPEACGSGTWGALELDGTTVHVDASAEPGGDGRAEAPVTTILAGIDLAGAAGGGMVAVAAGTYVEVLDLSSDHAGVHLAGRCRDLVVLDVSAASGDVAGLEIGAGSATAAVSGLTVSGSGAVGVRVRSGQVTLRDLTVTESGLGGMVIRQAGVFGTSVIVEDTDVVGSFGRGLLVLDGGTEVTMVSSTIRGTLPDPAGQGGYGVEVTDSATLDIESSSIEGNTAVGLMTTGSGTQVTIAGVTISDTLPASNGSYGNGVQVSGGASLVASDCLIARNRTEGLVAAQEGTSVVLDRTSIVDTQPDERGDSGYGLTVWDGASLAARSCEVAGNTGFGVLIYDPDTAVALTDTIVSGTLPDENSGHGSGILVTDGASLDAVGCLLDRNVATGVALQDPGTTATLRQTTVRSGFSSTLWEDGFGIEVADGARLEAVDCDVEDNLQVGVFVAGEGTSATLAGSDVRGTREGAGGENGIGVEVTTGATLRMAAGTLEDNTGAGLIVEDPGTWALVEDVRVMGTRSASAVESGWGVQAGNGASLELIGSEIAGNTEIGLLMNGAATEVALRDTVIRGTQPGFDSGDGYGIEVWGGAALQLESSSIVSNVGLGIAAESAGTFLRLVESEIRDTQPTPEGDAGFGLQIGGGAILVMESSEVVANTGVGLIAAEAGTEVSLRDCVVADTHNSVDGNSGYGVEAIRGARLDVSSCVLDGNLASGIIAFHADTLVTVQDSTITNTLHNGYYTVANGVIAQFGASVEAENISVSSTEGPGLLATVDDSSLSCTGCVVEGNEFAAAVVVHGASMQLEGSTLSGTASAPDLGGGVGVFAHPWKGPVPSLVLRDSEVRDNPIAGVWLSGAGSFELARNSIEGGSGETRGTILRCGDAVFAREGTTPWDGSQGLLLEDNTLSHGLGAGLFLDDGSATLRDNTWEDNAVDLWVQGADCSTLPEGYDEEPLSSSDTCPVWDLSTCSDTFDLYMNADTPQDMVEPERPLSPRSPLPRAYLRPAAPVVERQLLGVREESS